MEEYSLLYIDDEIDFQLSEYIDKHLNGTAFGETILRCNELTFNPEEGYKSLLLNSKVLSANIILIDSRLFEDRSASDGKFTGEEFKIILKKYYPFIEVIVITQNGEDESVRTLAKYDSNCGKDADEYYHSILPDIIHEVINQISIYRKLAERLKSNESWEPILKEKVIGALEGTGTYDELTKSDIDNLVIAFKEIVEIIDG